MPTVTDPLKIIKSLLIRVFGMSSNSSIDFKDVERQIHKNDWHFIVQGIFNKKNNKINMIGFITFLRTYGITFDTVNSKQYLLATENICRDL